MNASDWKAQQIAKLIAEYGAVPPPWVVFPNTHPYDIGWRMGGGEAHIEVFGTWWDRQQDQWNEAQRIDYFRQWPPPPCWLKWTIDVIWEIEADDEDDFDYSDYFARLEAIGFGSQADYEQDLDDPKWYAGYEED